jgi:hypothetical protein
VKVSEKVDGDNIKSYNDILVRTDKSYLNATVLPSVHNFNTKIIFLSSLCDVSGTLTWTEMID